MALSILNRGAGDTIITFENEEDLQVAKEMIDDMMRKGYSITVQSEGGGTDKVTGFDPAHKTYRVSRRGEADAQVDATTSDATAVPPVAGG